MLYYLKSTQGESPGAPPMSTSRPKIYGDKDFYVVPFSSSNFYLSTYQTALSLAGGGVNVSQPHQSIFSSNLIKCAACLSLYSTEA